MPAESVVARVASRLVEVGGTIHSGWRPAGSTPLPDPIRTLEFSFEIEFDGSGYLLLTQSVNGELFSDSWFESLEQAQSAALQDFGIRTEDWQYLQASSPGRP